MFESEKNSLWYFYSMNSNRADITRYGYDYGMLCVWSKLGYGSQLLIPKCSCFDIERTDFVGP